MAAHFQVDTGGTLTNNLLAYYKMDETSGTRVDFFSTHNLSDNNSVASVTGKISNASNYTFANSQWLSAGDNTFMDNPGAFSVSFWLKQPAESNQRGYIGKDDAVNGFKIIIVSQTLQIYLYNAAFTTYLSRVATGAIDNNNYNHFVITWDGTTANTAGIKMYFNTTEGGTDNGSATPLGTMTTATPLTIGRVNATVPIYSTCSIDEVGFWSRAITQTEVNDLYNANAGNTMVNGPTTVKTWNGVLISTGVKTINGNAIGSTKTINGVT